MARFKTTLIQNVFCRCPKEVTPHLHLIIRLCSKYLCHDPNYHYDDDDDDVEPMDGIEKNGDMDVDSGHGEQDSDEDQEYSDDDDMSWKVRRASAKCLEAALSTRREMLVEFYQETSPLLISRRVFFSCFICCLKSICVIWLESVNFLYLQI